MAFTCSICGEESTRICVRCTKDACRNHLCDKCHRCSDCCDCEVALDEHPHAIPEFRPRVESFPLAADGNEPLPEEPVKNEDS
jgi:hypothetical protein